MQDQRKTKQQLIDELSRLRQRVADQNAELAHSRQADLEWQQITDCLPVLIATAGFNGYYENVNSAFERILGWSRQESLAQPFIEFIHPDERAVAREVFQRIKSGTLITDFVDRNLCKDGSYRWIAWTLAPLPHREAVFGIGQDITRQKLSDDRRRQAEEDLRQSERTLSNLMSNLPGMAYRCRNDFRWTMEFVSSGANALTGYRPGDLTDNHTVAYGDLIHPDDREAVWLGVQQAVARRRPFQLEYRIRTAQGQIKWVWEQGSGVFSTDDKMEAMEGFIADVTDSVQAKERLRESERRLDTLISNLPGAVYRCKADADWTIDFLSDGYFALTGYDPAEFIGQPASRHSDLIHPDDRQREFDIMMEAIAQKKQYQIEYRLRTARGKHIWVWEQGMGVFDENGELEAIEGFSTDMTARKVAEEALKRSRDELEQRVQQRTADLSASYASLERETQERLRAQETQRLSEDKYRALVESSPDAVVVCDLDGTITYASRQAVRHHRFPDAEHMIGYHATDLIVAEERDMMRVNIQRLIQEGMRQDDHYTGLRYDGTTFVAEVSAAILRDTQGQPRSFMGIYRDITEREEAQEALRRSQESLYRMLQASDRERELITYEIHDGVAQRLLGALMQFEAYQNTTQQRSKKAQIIFQAGLTALHAAAAETRGLMNRTRSPVLQKFGIQAAIDDFLAQMSEHPGAPRINFQCESTLDRLAPTLENNLFRVAQEAITNACRHSKSAMVQVTLVQDNDTVTLEVRDQGIGFDASQDAPGRFGLHGIRERTRLLGKELCIESEPGKGTRVRATFPLLTRNEEDGADV